MKRSREEKDDDAFAPPKKLKVKEQMTTVKCGLRTVLRDDAVAESIQDAVLAMTRMSFEAAKLLNLHALRACTEKMKTFDWAKSQTVIEYAFRLVSKTDKESKTGSETKERGQPEILEQKRLLRETWQKFYLPVRPVDLPIPSRSHLGQVLRAARTSYLTAAMNYVTTNFYGRHRQYIRYCVEEIAPSVQGAKAIGAVVHRIYKETTCKANAIRECKTLPELLAGNVVALEACKTITNGIREQLEQLELFPVTAYKLKKDWPQFLPWFHEMLKTAQRASENATASFQKEKKSAVETKTEGGKKKNRQQRKRSERSQSKGPRTFTLLPEFSMQLKNIVIDTQALKDLCSGIRVGEKKQKGEIKAAAETDDELWARVLILDKIPRNGVGGYRFGKYFSTDGVCVNLNLRRPFAKTAGVDAPEDETTPDPQPDHRKTTPIKFDPLDLKDRRVVGLDPGRGDLFVSIDNQERVVKCGTKEYYWNAGFTRRRYATDKWMKRNPKAAKAFRLSPSSRVSTVDAYLVHVKHVLSVYATCETFYMHPRHRRWKRRVYIGKQKALSKMCKEISGNDRSTVVAFGAAGFSSSSKGHAAGPVQALKKCLRHHCTVVDIDEFRTSQLCSKCQCPEPMEGFAKASNPYKVRVCPNQDCRTVWNRDVNAAENMLAIFRYMNDHDGRERPPRFRRS